MTKATENTDDPGEVERLRSHKAELLAELKTAKAKATALQGQLDTATEERDAARAEVRALRLDGPLRALLEEIAVPGTAGLVAKMLDERGIRFDLEDAEIVVRDAEGNPATVLDPPTPKVPAPKPRPARFDSRDLTLLMTQEGVPEAERHPLAQAFPRFLVGTHASGGGSTGGAGKATPTVPDKPETKPSAPKTFGLT